jgi:hypothetical protein
MDVDQASAGENEEYHPIERQLAFKLLASHAMVNAEFYQQLRTDPAAAAEELHIALTAEDIDYILHKVDWEVIGEHAEEVRQALNLEHVVNPSW